MFKSKFVLLTVAVLLVFPLIMLSNRTTLAASVSATVTAGDEPDAVAVNSVTNMIYVVNQSSNNVTVINGGDNSSTSVAAGSEPNAVAVNSVANKVYVTNELSNDVTVINGSDNSATTVAAEVGPSAVAVNSATGKAYVANATSGSVTVIHGDNSTTNVTVGALPRAVTVNPETNRVYVANRDSGTVTVIDGSDDSVIATVDAGDLSSVVSVNSVTNRIYVANERSDDVTVIDGSNNNIITTVAVGGMPLDKPVAMVVNPATNKIYVAISNITSTVDTVTVINGSDNSTTTLTVGDNPGALAVDPVINQVYVANLFSDDLTVIDGSDNSTTTLTVGDNPAGVAVNPTTHKVYVANRNSNNVTVIDGQDQSQSQSQADLALTLFQDPSDGATGVKAEVSRVYDSATGEDLALQIQDFQAQLSYDGSCISVLDVRGGDFDITDSIIDDAGGVATFTGTAATGVTAPADLGRVLTRLQGSASESCPLTLQVTSLEDSSGNTLAVPATAAQDLRRGDAQADGNVNIADAMFIAQYLAELREPCTAVVNDTCLHSVNAASVLPDGTFDMKTIADASFIAQRLVGLRDELFALEQVTFDLNEENSSGQSGQARLTRQNGQTEVKLVLSPGALESELVHIHSGRCGPSLGDVVHPLTSFVDGSGDSVTTVDAPLNSLLTGDFAVNTHKKGDSSVFTACGNIPAGP